MSSYVHVDSHCSRLLCSTTSRKSPSNDVARSVRQPPRRIVHEHFDIMPPTDITQHRYFTFISVLLLLIALFPGLPHFLLGIPLRILISPPNPKNEIPITVPCPASCVAPDSRQNMSTSWFQKTFTLPSKSRGSYLITDHVVSSLPEIKDYKVGLLNLFIQHTSCALSLNENWDSDVREDMSDALDRIAPEDRKGNLYRHSAEGLDDMPVRGERQIVCAGR